MRRVPLLLLGATLIAPTAAWGQSETRTSADATVTAGYFNNPFSTAKVAGGDTGAAAVTFDLSPRVTILAPRSSLTLSLDANLQQYLRRYGSNDSYAGAVDYRVRTGERLTVHAHAEVSSAVLGTANSFVPFASPIGAGTADVGTALGASAGVTNGTATGGPSSVTVSPLVQYNDVGLFGLRSRRRSGRGSGDLALALSQRDSLTAQVYGEVSRYAASPTGDLEAVGGSLGYSRRLSHRVSAGLSGSASSYTYRNSDGDSRVYSLQATASTQLSEVWTADGALGVSFVDGNNAASTRSTSLSGNLDLCRRGPGSTMCLQLLRQVSPTGLVGTQYISSAGLSWNRRLDPRQSLSLGLNYSKVGNGDRLSLGALPLETEYTQASAGYNRRIAPRLGFVTSVQYRKLLNDTLRRPADYGGQVGLSYRLGDPR